MVYLVSKLIIFFRVLRLIEIFLKIKIDIFKIGVVYSLKV